MRLVMVSALVALLSSPALAGSTLSQEQIRADLQALSHVCSVSDEDRVMRRHECRRLIRSAVSQLSTFKGVKLEDKKAGVRPASMTK